MMVLKRKINATKPESPYEFEQGFVPEISFSGFTSLGFVGIVDIVGSTKIASTIEDDKLSLYYEIFLNSTAAIVKKHGGQVIKTIGDSLLYYFEENRYEACIMCGLDMIMSREKLSQWLSKYQLPCMHFRVSADFGKIHHAKNLTTGTSDVFGTPVNMAAKINGCAERDGFVIGGDFYQVARSAGFKFKEIKGYCIGLEKDYPIYSVKQL